MEENQYFLELVRQHSDKRQSEPNRIWLLFSAMTKQRLVGVFFRDIGWDFGTWLQNIFQRPHNSRMQVRLCWKIATVLR